MSLIEMSLKRRPETERRFKPTVEVLEARECPAVAAPTNLQLAALSPTAVKLTWSDVATESGYNIYRWNGTQAIFVAQVTRNTTTYTVGALPPNTTQWFQIEAFDLSTRARSSWASIVTPRQAITAPTPSVSGITLSQMTVSWSFVTGASGYRVFQWNGTSADQIASVGSTVNSFTVQNLTPGTNYYFYVQAYNSSNFANSGWVTGRTLSISLSAPTNVKAVAVDGSTINVSWNDGANETGYRVYRWNGNTGEQPVLVATLAANSTGFQDTGLLAGRTYKYYVQSFTATSTANSGWVEATTPGIPLLPPGNVTGVAIGPGTVRISWTEPATAFGYRVYVWGGSYWILATTVPKGTTSQVITNLWQNRNHWFLVQAFTENFMENAYANPIAVYV